MVCSENQYADCLEYTLGDADIKVAVIDAGLQTTHPDLRGQINQAL